MKKILIFCLMPLVVVALLAGGTVKTITSSTSFVSGGETDTITASMALNKYNTASFQFAVFGTDSVKILFAFDGYIGGKWVQGLKYDTLFVNETSAPTAARSILLRGYGTTSLAGYETIRARVTIGAIGTNDSISALYYKANLYLTD
jgi:hypothetical protein